MGMNKCWLLLLLCTSIASAQTAPGRYFVFFTNKNNNPYSLSNPSQFLSQRALDRRQRQGIALDQHDLPVTPAYLDSIRMVPNVQLIHWTKWLNGATFETNDTTALQTINNFSFTGQIKSVSISGKSKPKAYTVPVTREGNWEVQTDSYYGAAWNQIRMLNGHLLHRMGYTGAGKVIAVLDSGFPSVDNLEVFSEMRQDGRLLGAYDFIHMEEDVSQEMHFHGTAVLSCMGAYLPGQQIGTAPGASYWLFVSENTSYEYVTEEDNWVVAAEYADSVGVDIINSSLGYTEFDDSLTNHTYPDMDGNTCRASIGADIAASRGILVVVSAGNSGATPWMRIGAPSDGDSVMAVGAVDKYGAYAFFSSKGYSADGDVKPNVASQGWDASLVWPDGSISPGSGTSFSSPIMAGMAACLWQAFPDKTNMEIMHAIEQSGNQSTQPDSLMGYGIPDFSKAYEILSGQPISMDFEDRLVSLFPNPFTDQLYLDYFSTIDQSVEIEILDVHGKIVYSDQVALIGGIRNRITMKDLHDAIPRGIYILHFSTEEGSFSKRIVKY